MNDILDPAALITIDMMLVSPSLDVIANQETSIELNKEQKPNVTLIEGRFELPVFSLELRRDVLNSNIEPGTVNLTYTEFGLTYEKLDHDTNTVQMALKGLLMENLLLSLEPDGVLSLSSIFEKIC